MKPGRPHLTLAALLATCASVLAAPGDPPAADFSETRLAVRKGSGLLALRDLTGDGRYELLSLTPRGLVAQALDERGVYETAGALLEWPASGTGWAPPGRSMKRACAASGRFFSPP